jgi:hypothetical protein
VVSLEVKDILEYRSNECTASSGSTLDAAVTQEIVSPPRKSDKPKANLSHGESSATTPSPFSLELVPTGHVFEELENSSSPGGILQPPPPPSLVPGLAQLLDISRLGRARTVPVISEPPTMPQGKILNGISPRSGLSPSSQYGTMALGSLSTDKK